MRSFQDMDKIIQLADKYLDAESKAFDSKNWSEVNVLRKQLREMIDNYYHKQK